MQQRKISQAELLNQRAMLKPSEEQLSLMIRDVFGDEAEVSIDGRMRLGFITAHLAMMVGAALGAHKEALDRLAGMGQMPEGRGATEEEVRFGLYYLNACLKGEAAKTLPGMSEAGQGLLQPYASKEALGRVFQLTQ